MPSLKSIKKIVGASAGALLGIGALSLLATKPGHPQNVELNNLSTRLFAHRGSFDNEAGIPENSIPAFERAIANGYGIELDVHITADNVPVVFHDESLKRMCGVDKMIEQCPYDEIHGLFLLDTDIEVPTLLQVLEVVDRRVPLCIELKSRSIDERISSAVEPLLSDYAGDFVVVSFDPVSLYGIRKRNPHMTRGQLVTNFFKLAKTLPFMEKLGLNNMLFNFLSQPNFFSYDIDYIDDLNPKLMRRLYPRIDMVWTIRSQSQLDAVKSQCELIVFEGFDPVL